MPRDWLATKDFKPNDPLFSISGRVAGGKERKTYKMMRDLEAARDAWIEEGETGEELLFDLVSTAYERQSLLITTNLPFESRTEVLGSERLTGAALDRLTTVAEEKKGGIFLDPEIPQPLTLGHQPIVRWPRHHLSVGSGQRLTELPFEGIIRSNQVSITESKLGYSEVATG